MLTTKVCSTTVAAAAAIGQGHGHGREEEEEEEEEGVWEDTALHAFSCLVSCPLQMYWYTAV